MECSRERIQDKSEEKGGPRLDGPKKTGVLAAHSCRPKVEMEEAKPLLVAATLFGINDLIATTFAAPCRA